MAGFFSDGLFGLFVMFIIICYGWGRIFRRAGKFLDANPDVKHAIKDQAFKTASKYLK